MFVGSRKCGILSRHVIGGAHGQGVLLKVTRAAPMTTFDMECVCLEGDNAASDSSDRRLTWVTLYDALMGFIRTQAPP